MKADIQHQDSTYRRGLVLGLTMAEIMVLILFALLLAMAASFELRERELVRLRAVETAINEAFKGQPSSMTAKKLVELVEKQQVSIASLQKQLEQAKGSVEKAAIVDDIFQALRKAGADTVEPKKFPEMIQLASAVTKHAPGKDGNPPSPAQISDALTKYAGLQAEVTNLKGQNNQLSDRIRQFGRGNEFPSCWATPEGKSESIFEVLISSTGITITNRALPHRQEQQASLPLAQVRYDTDLPIEEFRAQLRDLYNWSIREKCRFYVIIFSSERATRNDLLNAVYGYFYPDSTIRYRAKAQ